MVTIGTLKKPISVSGSAPCGVVVASNIENRTHVHVLRDPDTDV